MDAPCYALFCTAPDLALKINELLQCAHEARFVGDIFSLMRSPSQEHFDKPTLPTVADFESGFLNWSIEQLGSWCKEKFTVDDPTTQVPDIEPEAFAVLDQRTLRDGTVLLTKFDFWHEPIDPRDRSNEREMEGWREVRVEMEGAPLIMLGLPELYMSQILDDIKPEDDGVMKWN